MCVSTAQSSFELGPHLQQPLLHSNKIDESDNMTKKERMADTEPLEQTEQQEDTAKQHDIEVDSTVQSNGVIQRTEEENSWTGGAERHSPEGEVSVKKKKTKKHKKDKAKKKEKSKLEQPQQDKAKVEKDDDKKAEVSDPESTATEIEVMVEVKKIPAIDVHTAAAATSRGETNTPIADKTATQEEKPEAAKLTATKEELFKNVAVYDPTATTQTKKEEEPAAVTKEQDEPASIDPVLSVQTLSITWSETEQKGSFPTTTTTSSSSRATGRAHSQQPERYKHIVHVSMVTDSSKQIVPSPLLTLYSKLE